MASRANRAARPSSGGPSLTPIFVTIAGLVIAAVAVAVMQNMDKAKKAEAAKTVEENAPPAGANPFGDVDNSPKAYGGGSKLTDLAPEGLADTEPYASARATARAGLDFVAEAAKARASGDEDGYQTKGKKGQEKLEEALFATTDWLMDVQDRYPNDRQVARIEKEMDTWGRGLRKVRKIK